MKKKVKDQIGHEDLQLQERAHPEWTKSAYRHCYVTLYMTANV